jgi:hypothetical protein
MTVTLELTPEVRARLARQAEALGMTLESYLQHLLQERSAGRVASETTHAERAAAFEAWAHGHAVTPPLPDDAIRREHMVRDAQ